MAQLNLGDQLYRIIGFAKASLFEQGELAQLTYGAFDIAVRNVQDLKQNEIELKYPVGYLPNRVPIEGTLKYQKEELLNRYKFLAFHQLSVNGLIKLVAIVEAMLGDIVRAVAVRYPEKLGGKRSVPLQVVLRATSMEDIHLQATDSLLNELSYKSPAEFAEALISLISINLMECPPFHKYIEIKATRDIHVHNRGVANDTYLRKAGTHSRVKAGTALPVDTQYFLESYEVCLQVSEWLEEHLHNIWHSSELEDYKTKQMQIPLSPLSEIPPADSNQKASD